MPVVINISQAKTQLSKLLVRVEKGEEFLITKSGEPYVRLIPYEEKAARHKKPRRKGKS